MEKISKNPNSNVLKLVKDDYEADIILSRLHSISDVLSEMESDPYLENAHNKVIEAIDWYLRFCEDRGFLPYQGEKQNN